MSHLSLSIAISLILCLSACQPNQKASPVVDAQGNTEDDYCNSFNLALNGAFEAKFMEGTMIWQGGTEGTVEIRGVDFNEMTCSYIVPDCSVGQLSMNCDGSAYATSITLYTQDSMLLGTTIYTRVK